MFSFARNCLGFLALAAIAFVGAASVGLFVIPVVFLLAVSTGYTPRGTADK